MYSRHGFGNSVGSRLRRVRPLQLAVGIGASIVIAAGSYYLLEKPFLRLSDRLQAR